MILQFLKWSVKQVYARIEGCTANANGDFSFIAAFLLTYDLPHDVTGKGVLNRSRVEWYLPF